LQDFSISYIIFTLHICKLKFYGFVNRVPYCVEIVFCLWLLLACSWKGDNFK